MPFALLLPSRDPPDATALSAAFEQLSELTAADARRRAHSGQGVLLVGLEKATARTLQKALLEQGLVVERVSDRWLALPESERCRRAVPATEALQIYDEHGQATPIPWAQLMTLAVGFVPVGESMMVREAETISIGQFGEYETSPEYQYRETDRLVLDLVTRDPVRRLRIESDRFDYGYLKGRKTRTSARNFAALVSDLAAHAPEAAHNAGADAILAQSRTTIRYRSEALFERETGWLLWRHQGPGAQYDGDLDFRREPFVAEAPPATFTDVARRHQADQVMAKNEADCERHMDRTELVDRVLAAVIGLAAAVLGARKLGFWCDGFDLSTCEAGAFGPVVLALIGLVIWLVVGVVGHRMVREWRRRSFWS